MCRHSCQWVLSKEFKGSSVFFPFTGQANQLGTSFKLGSEPSSSSSWIQDIQFLILLYVRQEKTAPGGTPLHPTLPAHPQLSNDTAAVSEPWWQKAGGKKGSMGKAEWRHEAVMQQDTVSPQDRASQPPTSQHLMSSQPSLPLMALQLVTSTSSKGKQKIPEIN